MHNYLINFRLFTLLAAFFLTACSSTPLSEDLDETIHSRLDLGVAIVVSLHKGWVGQDPIVFGLGCLRIHKRGAVPA